MRTKRLGAALSTLMVGMILLPLSVVAQGQGGGPRETIPADGRGNYIRQLAGRSGTSGSSPTTGNGINYNGGPVIENGVHVYYIWYGNWGQDATANAILTDFAQNVGGSPYFAINTTYADTHASVQNSVTYSGSMSDSGSLGTSLTDSSIWTLVNNALSKGALPADPNGVYFVLTAPFVAETSGFLSSYCGWHTVGSYGTTAIKYSFVGNPAANMGACSIQGAGPNGDAQADAMVSVIAHELEESTTDPQLNAWYDASGAENADKCAWNFGATYAAPNGASANMQLGARNFLIQQNWVNAGGGYCALSYAASPDFGISVSPASQTVTAGGATGSYTMTSTALNGWSGTVAYSVTAGLPTGAVATVSGNTITIGTSSSVPAGTYNFTIQGTSGSLTHTTTASLVVSAPDFKLSVSPASQGVAPGGTTGNYTVIATAVNGWSGTVTYSVTGGLPSGASAQVVANTITVATTASVAAGSYTFTIQGTDGLRTHTVTATVVVSAPAFSISFSPASQSLTRPSSTQSSSATATYTVVITPAAGFAGMVNLTASGATTGLSLSLSSPSVTGGGTATLTATVTSAAKPGNRTLTVTGTSGGVTKSASATLKLN